MARWISLMVFGLVLGACGGDDQVPLGEYSEECTATEECEDGLQCATGLCTAPCMMASDCLGADPAGKSICLNNGFCYIACTSLQSCPSHLNNCTMVGTTQGTCRP